MIAKLNFQCHMILQKTFWSADTHIWLFYSIFSYFYGDTFPHIYLWIESSKNAFVFKYNYFINVFSVTCDQFNAPLLNRSINFNHTTSKLWNDSVQSIKFFFRFGSCYMFGSPQREQMYAAQEMFKTANKVTRPEKALILGLHGRISRYYGFDLIRFSLFLLTIPLFSKWPF